MSDGSVIAEAPTPTTAEQYNRVIDDILSWAKSVEDIDTHWIPVKVSGVDLRERQGSNTPFIRIEVTINKPIEVVSAFLRSTNESERRKIDPDLAFIKAYPVPGAPADRDLKLLHQRVKLPWPVSARDSFTVSGVVGDGDKMYVLSGSVNDTTRAPHDKSAVRSFVKMAEIMTAQGQCTHLVRLITVDPRGNIPIMLVNAKKGENANRALQLKKLLEQ
eukprot:m51a1_g3059 hypothetical protein (218) ;mRNA; f:1000041-1000936